MRMFIVVALSAMLAAAPAAHQPPMESGSSNPCADQSR